MLACSHKKCLSIDKNAWVALCSCIQGTLPKSVKLAVYRSSDKNKPRDGGEAVSEGQKQTQDANVSTLIASISKLQQEKTQLQKEKNELLARLAATKGRWLNMCLQLCAFGHNLEHFAETMRLPSLSAHRQLLRWSNRRPGRRRPLSSAPWTGISSTPAVTSSPEPPGTGPRASRTARAKEVTWPSSTRPRSRCDGPHVLCHHLLALQKSSVIYFSTGFKNMFISCRRFWNRILWDFVKKNYFHHWTYYWCEKLIQCEQKYYLKKIMLFPGLTHWHWQQNLFQCIRQYFLTFLHWIIEV